MTTLDLSQTVGSLFGVLDHCPALLKDEATELI